ncbi:unnamed protein product [Triticum turgidum subsp. durum]|uniref:Glutathione S-transferase n=1 Tax=Triticum turgidum subsp. durum TaxID=4567 RepID=A0A9R0XJA3_TRITD|nr:unnamed protein product [Triticum turgidum subsp. durum]
MAGEKGLVLLDFWVSPFGQRVRIALAEKGLPYEYVEEDLMAGKSDRLLRSNPVHKKIPVLLHDGRPVNESLIILQYLEDAFPDAPALLPSDPYARAQARFWADYVDKPFFGGDKFGLVDAAFAPFTAWFHSYERYGEFSLAEVAPKIAAWAKRCGERESVAKSLYSPDKVYDFIGLLKKKYGIE